MALPYDPQPISPSTPPSARYTVTEVRYLTVKYPATALDRQDADHWWVTCENRCGNVITVGKRHWIPLDFAVDGGPVAEVRLDAPAARRCPSCALAP